MCLSRERLQCKYVQSSMLMLAPPSFLSPPPSISPESEGEGERKTPYEQNYQKKKRTAQQ